jgi:beta-N-acetylglucosaminidase
VKKKLIIASAIAVSGMGMAGSALAATSTDTSGRDDFASKFATRFNLNKDDVTKFMDENRAARDAERETKVAEALKAAGFTDSQITALKAKKAEQRTAHDAWETANPNATQAERKAQREADKVAFEVWAKDQGIDLTKVRTMLKDSGIGRGHRGMGGPGMMRGDSEKPDEAPVN